MLYAILHITQKHIWMQYCFYLDKLGCINILISFLRNKNFILSAWKFKECFGLKQASDCYYKLVTKKLTTIFWWYSEANEQSWSIHWILLDVFFYIQLSFSTFFMDSKVNCQIHMITNMFKNIWKEYLIKECFWSERNILCVRFFI